MDVFVICAVPPVIQYESKLKETQTVKSGGSLSLPVTFTGTPTPKITWYCGETELKTGNGTTIETNGASSRLVIKNVTAANVGIYRVKAENSAGSDEAQFTTALKGALHLFIRLFCCVFVIRLLDILQIFATDGQDSVLYRVCTLIVVFNSMFS